MREPFQATSINKGIEDKCTQSGKLEWKRERETEIRVSGAVQSSVIEKNTTDEAV